MLYWPLNPPDHHHLELRALTFNPLDAPPGIHSHSQDPVLSLTTHNHSTILPTIDSEMTNLPHREASPPEVSEDVCEPSEVAEPASCQDFRRAIYVNPLNRAMSLPNCLAHRQTRCLRAASCPPAHLPDDGHSNVETSGQLSGLPAHVVPSPPINPLPGPANVSHSVRMNRSKTPELDIPMASSSQETIRTLPSDDIGPVEIPEVVKYDTVDEFQRQVANFLSPSPPEFDYDGGSAQLSGSRLGKRRREESQARSTKIIRVLKKPFVSPMQSRPLTKEPVDDVHTSTASVKLETAQTTATPVVTPAPIIRPLTTRRLATPFKPPRTASSAPPATNIRSLEDRARLLRQAVRFHTRPEEDDHVEELVHKWRAAGREIVELLFSCVPRPDEAGSCIGWQGYNPLPLDRSGDVFMASGIPEQLQENADSKMEDFEAPGWSFGTMMTRMGVDPALLGWDEGQEDWLD